MSYSTPGSKDCGLSVVWKAKTLWLLQNGLIISYALLAHNDMRNGQIIMASCLEQTLWCVGGTSPVCSHYLFTRPLECEHLWHLPVFLKISLIVWVEIFEAASIHFTSVESSTQIPFNGLDPDNIWPCQVLCMCSELVSTRKTWKYLGKNIKCQRCSSMQGIHEMQLQPCTSNYYCSWDDVACLCMKVLFYPHFSYPLVNISQTVGGGY